MHLVYILFWVSAAIIGYTYLGYPLLLALLVRIKEGVSGVRKKGGTQWPTVTLIIAAYNEEICIADKLKNSLALKYPQGQLKIWVVTDGSTDGTNDWVRSFPEVSLFYQSVRKGKLEAIQRVISEVKSDWIVFTDANALLNEDAILQLMEQGREEGVGVVAGEKRVNPVDTKGGGESWYWRYESTIKDWEGRFYSVTGTAGELYAVRTNLYTPVPVDTISDDLEIGWAIVEKGYRIAYAAAAISEESDISDWKLAFRRRVRVAAGSVQSALRLLQQGKKGWQLAFWWEVISHRILRTLVAPYCLILLLLSNACLISIGPFFGALFFVQLIAYFMTALYCMFPTGRFVSGLLIWPVFFILAHFAMIKGAWLLLSGRATVLWEPVPRGEGADMGKSE